VIERWGDRVIKKAILELIASQITRSLKHPIIRSPYEKELNAQ